MRIGISVFLFCTAVFAMIMGPVPRIKAMADGSDVPAEEIVAQPAEGDEGNQQDSPAPGGDEDPAPPARAAAGNKQDGADYHLLAPVKVPPFLVGQNGSETVMIASDPTGDVISVITFEPGLADPLHPAPQFESTIDLGNGLNAQLTWDIAGGSFTFSFVP